MRKGKVAREFSISGRLRVELVTHAGDVEVRAHEGSTARVELLYRLRGWGKQEVERGLVERPPIRFEDGLLRVGPEPEGVDADWRLFLPAEAEVEVEVGSGDVSAAGLTKRLRASTGSGDLSLAGVSGEVVLRCGSGDVQLQRVFGALSLRTGSGDVYGTEVKGDVEIETGSGDVLLRGAQGELRISTGSGDVRVEGALEDETWRVETGSGDAFIGLPRGVAAELDLATEFGDIACDLPVSVQEREEGRLVGRSGEPARARVRVRTASGDIHLAAA